MKKINLFLLVLVLVLGVFILAKQFMPKDTEVTDAPPVVDESVDVREVGLSDPESPEATKISEVELHKHIKNKRYLENTYMALEYSKVNNKQMIETLKAYADDNTKMKPEDVTELIQIHEKTFLNRYLKVFVSSPDSELIELNTEMRRIFYQMKIGFDELHSYGAIPIAKSSTSPEGAVDAEGNPVEPPEGQTAPAAGATGTTGTSSPTTSSTQPTTMTATVPSEPVYEMNDILLGIQKLEEAESYVNEALKLLGLADIEIEKQWLAAGISESDLNEIIDKTNIVNPDLSEDTSFGTEEEESREDNLDSEDNSDSEDSN